MKNLDNDEAADVHTTIAVYKAYIIDALIDILGSHVSISCCLSSHQLLGQQQVFVL